MNRSQNGEGDRARRRAARPTEADLRASERLSRLWELRTRRGDQAQLAASWHGPHGAGITAGAVSQYLHGTIPLNAEAVIRFAEFLNVDPLDLRDDLPELRKLAQERTGAAIREPAAPPPVDERILDARWRTYSVGLKADIVRLVEGARQGGTAGVPEHHGVGAQAVVNRLRRTERRRDKASQSEGGDGTK